MKKKLLKHVVLFKIKEEATAEDKDFVISAFQELAKSVPGVVDFECGPDVSPEGKAQGFTHLFVVSYNSDADRDAYLIHDAHKAFGPKVRPFIVPGGVLVFDYWAV